MDYINEIEYQYIRTHNLLDILDSLLEEENNSLSHRNNIQSLRSVISEKRNIFKHEFESFLSDLLLLM